MDHNRADADTARRAPPGAIGSRVRDFRVRTRLTQGALAERAGLCLETVWKIENGRQSPHRSTVRLIAQALGVAESALLA